MMSTSSTGATQRLQSIAHQLNPSGANSQLLASSTDTSQAPKASKRPMPPITCHVLDTASGKPASQIPVTLTLLSASVSSLSTQPSEQAARKEIATATTNSDGRIPAWSSEFEIQDGQVYQLRFETWEYFKGNTFFPYVEVTFVVDGKKDGRDHYHVPVLLAPWSYSTYRGS